MKKLITRKMGISCEGIILFLCKLEFEGAVTFKHLDHHQKALKTIDNEDYL